jgi:predicted acetyltransferase
MPRVDRFVPWEVQVRDFVALSSDAYLGLWQHLLTHDLATRLAIHMPIDDPFPDLVENPWKVEMPRSEGPMMRVVDIERALGRRQFAGSRPVSFTMRVADNAAPWNEGVWRINGGEGQLTAELKGGDADVELNAGTLAPIYTGFMRPEVAAGVGLVKVNRSEALEDMREAFAATHPPYSQDWY